MLDAASVGYTRYVGKCRDTDLGIRCVYTVTVSPQGLHHRSLDAVSNSERNKITSNIHEASHLSSNHENMDTRIVLR